MQSWSRQKVRVSFLQYLKEALGYSIYNPYTPCGKYAAGSTPLKKLA